MREELQLKYDRLIEYFVGRGKVGVAFSGGVDSTLVLYAASKVLGEQVQALHARMPWQSSADDAHVQSIARYCGSRLLVLDIDPLAWPEFVNNPVDRCYWCKKKIFTLFLQQIGETERTSLVDGTNADDLHQFRPGLAALEELGVGKPLAHSALGKSEIRVLSREFGLPTWNRPPGSCLATRIASGEKVTAEKLALIGAVEDLLNARGYAGCRARLSGDALLVELQAVDIKRFSSNEIGLELIDFVKKMGNQKIYLDLEGRRELDKNGRFA